MIRPRPLRPREQRNLRHWGMELIVVVVGVLLALWAQEWAEGQRAGDQHREALDALNREIKISQAMASRAVITDDCIADQVDRLVALLRRDDPNWPGMIMPGNHGQTARIPISIAYPLSGFSTDTYDRARQTGAFEGLTDQQKHAYEEIYFAIRSLDRVHTAISQIEADLRPLAYAQTLDADARIRLFQALAQFDRRRMIGLSSSEQLALWAANVGVQLTSADTEILDEFQERPRLISEYGPCVKEVDWTTGKAREVAVG